MLNGCGAVAPLDNRAHLVLGTTHKDTASCPDAAHGPFGLCGGDGQDDGIAQISHMRCDLETRLRQIATAGVLQTARQIHDWADGMVEQEDNSTFACCAQPGTSVCTGLQVRCLETRSSTRPGDFTSLRDSYGQDGPPIMGLTDVVRPSTRMSPNAARGRS